MRQIASNAGWEGSIVVEKVKEQNAASIASLLLTTEGLVAELPEEDKAPKYPTPPGGDMY